MSESQRLHILATYCEYIWTVDYIGTQEEAIAYLWSKFPQIPQDATIRVIDIDAPPTNNPVVWAHTRLGFVHGKTYESGGYKYDSA